MLLFSSRLLPARQALPLSKAVPKDQLQSSLQDEILQSAFPSVPPAWSSGGTPVYLALKRPSSSHDVPCGPAASVGSLMLSMDALGTEPAIAAKVSSPGVGSPGETKAAPGGDGHQALRKGILLPKLLICD